jgi:hypothetical protein
MPSGRTLAIALPAVLLVVVIVLAGLRTLREPASSPAAGRPLQVSPMPSAQAATAAVATSAPSIQPPQASAASAALASTPAERVDAWSRSGDPHQAMQAYQAVFDCLLARRRAHAPEIAPDKPRNAAASVCGDLRSDQIQQRLAWLEIAARAGETDAASDFIQEGPGGNGVLQDLSMRDPTPPTADWLARRTDYVERALQHCDTGLAAYLGFAIRQREAREKAVTQYWQGRLACAGQPATNTTPLADDAEGQADLDALTINAWQQ